MKGLVFVELLEMAETVMSEDDLDAVLDALPLESGGAYTKVGNYPCAELMMIVDAIGKHLNAPIDDLQRQFGHWMFASFTTSYPEFLEGKQCVFDMLESIEGEVHVEVRKLYPDAELPVFETERKTPDCFVMCYSSERPLRHFCHGLIEACVEFYGKPAEITVVDTSAGDRCGAQFTINRAA